MKKLSFICAALLSVFVLAVACDRKPVETDVTVTLNKTSVELVVGESEKLTLKVTPDDVADKSVVWSSSDESVVTVTEGVVRAVGSGTATVTVETNGKSAVCTVSVTDADSPLQSE